MSLDFRQRSKGNSVEKGKFSTNDPGIIVYLTHKNRPLPRTKNELNLDHRLKCKS